MSAPRSVVIVDDDPDWRGSIRRLLEEAGYVVIGEAETAEGGLRFASEHPPEVAIVDVNLPDTDGLRLADELARMVPRPAVVLVSANREFRARNHPLRHEFLSKGDLTVEALQRSIAAASKTSDGESADVSRRGTSARASGPFARIRNRVHRQWSLRSLLLGAVASLGFSLLGPLVVVGHTPWKAYGIRFIVTGVGLLVSGGIAYSRAASRRLGALISVLGFTWFLPFQALLVLGLLFKVERRLGWVVPCCAITDQVEVLARVLVSLSLAIVGHLLLAFPTGRLLRRLDRRLVVALYAWIALSRAASESVASLVRHHQRALLFDPLAHPGVAVLLMKLSGFGTACLLLLVMGRFAVRWLGATRVVRRTLIPVLISTVPLGVAVLVMVDPAFISKPDMARNALLNSGEFAVAAVPLVMAIGSLRVGISRVHSADRITDLPQAFSSSDLESYIGRVLQDPTVKVRLQFRTPAVDAGLADPEESESRGDDPLLDTLGPLREGRLRVGFRDENERLNAVVEYDGGVDGETAQACFRMVALLITSHRLRRMAQAAFGEVSASRRRLMEAQDLAYNQLARDIHDGAKKHFATSVSLVRDLLRSFTTSGSAVSREALEGLLRLLLQGSKSLDNLSRGVYPDSIEWTGGLVGVLEDIAADAEFRVFVDGEPCADETAFDAIPHAVKVALWRVASEALTNAEKYAPDARKSVYLRRVGELVVLEVKDDGPGGAAPVHGHNGLANMLDRVKTLDGKLRIHSPHHEGTAIIAELPAR